MPPNKPKPPKIDLSDNDFTCILAAAIRYTLGRESYMPRLVTDYIRPLLPYLTDKALWLFERDIREQQTNIINRESYILHQMRLDSYTKTLKAFGKKVKNG